jgi:hypothetical protein
MMQGRYSFEINARAWVFNFRELQQCQRGHGSSALARCFAACKVVCTSEDKDHLLQGCDSARRLSGLRSILGRMDQVPTRAPELVSGYS